MCLEEEQGIQCQVLSLGILNSIWFCSHNLHKNNWMKVILFSKGMVVAIQANLVTSQQDFYCDLCSESQLLEDLCQNCIVNCTHVSMHFSLLFTFHISDRIKWMDVGWLRSDSLISNRFIQHCLHIWGEKIDSALLWKCPDSENRKLEIFGFL